MAGQPGGIWEASEGADFNYFEGPPGGLLKASRGFLRRIFKGYLEADLREAGPPLAGAPQGSQRQLGGGFKGSWELPGRSPGPGGGWAG